MLFLLYKMFGMFIKDLVIENYKIFRYLKVEDLRRVNLIGGKNNVGKSLLLEALRIYSSNAESSVINNILYKRGDWEDSLSLDMYGVLFNNNYFKDENEFVVSDVNNELNGKTRHLHAKQLSINDLIFRIRFFNSSFSDIDKIESYRDPEEIHSISPRAGDKKFPLDKALFVPSNIEFDNTNLWKSIELTPKEDKVIDILRLIIPEIQGLRIGPDKKAKIRIQDNPEPLLLKNFGEGTNRLLTIALALVNAENNLLLIDEFETGLHHSVQEQLWEVIFQIAVQLNVQVFATTHSRDCISSFSYVASRNDNKEIGQYFRLSKDNSEDVVTIKYSTEDLETSLFSNIEMR